MRVVKSVPEEQHANQDKCRGNCIPDKVHPMDALTATEPGVFVLDIKTILAFFHLNNQPRQKSSAEFHQRGRIPTRIYSEQMYTRAPDSSFIYAVARRPFE